MEEEEEVEEIEELIVLKYYKNYSVNSILIQYITLFTGLDFFERKVDLVDPKKEL